MATKILRLPAVRERTGLSRAQIYKLMRVGRFPRQLVIGPRCVGWDSRDIDKFVLALIKDARANPQVVKMAAGMHQRNPQAAA